MRPSSRLAILPCALAIAALPLLTWLLMDGPEPVAMLVAPTVTDQPVEPTTQLPSPAEPPATPADWVKRGDAEASFYLVDPAGKLLPPELVTGLELWRRVGSRWLACSAKIDWPTWQVTCGSGSYDNRIARLEPGDYLLHVRSGACGNLGHSFSLAAGQKLHEHLKLPRHWRIVELYITDARSTPVEYLANRPTVAEPVLEAPSPIGPPQPAKPVATIADSLGWILAEQTDQGVWHIALPADSECLVELGYFDAGGAMKRLPVAVPATLPGGRFAISLAEESHAPVEPGSWTAPDYRGNATLRNWRDDIPRPRPPAKEFEGDPAKLHGLAAHATRVLFDVDGPPDMYPRVELLNDDGST